MREIASVSAEMDVDEMNNTSILIATPEELSVPKGSERADRYFGYMAETLETLYFFKNSERNGGKLNVVHTLCRLYT